MPYTVLGSYQKIYTAELNQKRRRNEIVTADQYAVSLNTAKFCAEIAQTGRLLINDSLSNYANRILDVLLKDDPELRKQLHVYFYYSSGTNAVTLENGMIIIELGLMAHVKNEAQLAFILAHEVGHYREKHILKYFQFSHDKKQTDENLVSVLKYSRDLEQDADSIGFEIIKACGYAIYEAATSFDMLRDSDMPEEQIPFSPSFFEHGQYIFPEDYHSTEIYAVEKDDLEETLSTHPSCETRKLRIEKLMKDDSTSGNLFLVSESSFKALRWIAREECCVIYLEDHDFGNAIYCSYEILQTDSNNVVAQKVIGKALYNYAADLIDKKPVVIPKTFIVSVDETNDFDFGPPEEKITMTPFNKVGGESQQVHYFFSRMSHEEVTILALDWNWRLYRMGNYSDPLLNRMCNNLMRILPAYYGLTSADFSLGAIEMGETKDVADSTKLAQEKRAAYRESLIRDQIKPNKDFKKVDNIPKENRLGPENKLKPEYKTGRGNALPSLSEYCYRGFDLEFTDSVFIIRFSLHDNDTILPDQYPNNIVAKSEHERMIWAGLNISRIYILPLEYYKLNEEKKRGSYSYSHSESESMQKEQQARVFSYAQSRKGDYIFLCPEIMDSTKISDYNTYCLLQQWLSEEFSNSSNALSMNLAHSEMGDSLVEKMGIRYLMFSSVVAEHQKRVRSWLDLSPLIVLPFTAPFALIYATIPRYHCQMQSYLFDLKTGEVTLYYEDRIKANANGPRLSSYYTKVFNKISRKR
ncbi:hypothetical protein BH09BAC5_BH09BAC5_07380 [soil metagenome]